MKVGILTIHGMGSDKEKSHEKILSKIRKHVSDEIELVVYPVRYYEKYQNNQDALLKRMGKIGMKRIRNFVIGSLGDVGTIGFSNDEYKLTMNKIKTGVDALNIRCDGGPIVVLAHSFGCQMFSCYMWDNQETQLNNNIERLFTMGCNIPMFVSGLNELDITPFKKPNSKFRWFNFWGKKDALGYPMRQINSEYWLRVNDIKVRFLIPIFSHFMYKRSRKVYKKIAREINEFGLH